jgi:SOS-response transcriptional repressor LexA
VQTYFPCSAASFALTVAGDSMGPEFRDGDVVVFDPSVTPVPGDYVFVEIGETKLFRRYRPLTVGAGPSDSYELVPSNPDWPTVRVTPSDNAVMKGVLTERASPRRKT